jgi:hypothetical protein
MPIIRRHEWIDRTNKPGTCFYCGKVLDKPFYSSNYSGLWCTLTCALWFADAMIKNKYVLAPWRGDPNAQNQEKEID